MYVVAIAGLTILVSLVLLCVGCREHKKLSENGTTVATNNLTSSTAVHLAEEKADNNIPVHPGVEHPNNLSRHSSLSSRGSVRITITNLADNDNTGPDSPVSQTSGGGSMVDRELPKLPDTDKLDEDHDYDVLDEQKTRPAPTVDYDTIDNLTADYSDLPSIRGTTGDYATVKKTTVDYATISAQPPKPSYQTIPERRPSYDAVPEGRPSYDAAPERKPSYSALPDLRRPPYEAVPTNERRPSYECLPDLEGGSIPRLEKSHTIGAIGGRNSPRPFSEGYFMAESTPKSVDKHRAGSERRAKDKEDCVSVIYASINPEFRTHRQKCTPERAEYSTVTDYEPPVPENPYAMLDNLLEDLKIPNPDNTPDKIPKHEESERVYDDIENLRPNSENIDELTPVSAVRRANPVIIKSSPFAVNNVTRTSSAPASPVYNVESVDT